MGKIVVVQEGGGGCEQYISHGKTGFLFNFKDNNDWEFFLKTIKKNYDLEYISRQARNVVPRNGYEKSIEEVSKIIGSS